MRCVLLAIAALGVALTLQGCGGPPSFVLDECKGKLTYILANSTVNGVAAVNNACTVIFTALRQQQICLAQEATTIQEAKEHLMKPYISECGEFVMAEACPKKSDCDGKPDKLKPSAGFAAVNSFVSSKSASILAEYAIKLQASIKAVTQKHYDQKFSSRLVPQIVQTQCTLNTETKVDDVRLTQPPISAMSIKCNDLAKTSAMGGTGWYTACVSAGTEAIIAALKTWKRHFISRCNTGTLNAVCPKGSACAIETSAADPQWLMNAASEWVTQNYNAASAQGLVTLGNVVSGWIFNGPGPRLFEVNGFEVTTTHLASGGAFFATGFAILGLGALLVARRRAQSSMNGRAILVKSGDVEEELAADLE